MTGSQQYQVAPTLLPSSHLLPDMQKETTCIKVTKETRDQLATLGTLKDNYDSVIRRLIQNGGPQ